ncbi:MAG TPA: PadR family transcriptional regulator [Steroidobacteraceae bacterium]|nr:PadR family transcriptional regulator [Steroidobacteraceae bacterium]
MRGFGGFGRRLGRHGMGHRGRGGGRPMEDWERRSGRIAGPGDIKLLLLSLLADEPRHGYELIRMIEEMTGGAYVPSPGVIYPTLALLEEEELLRLQAQQEEGKKRYAVTAAGRKFLAANEAQLEGLKDRLRLDARAREGGRLPVEVEQALRTFKHAMRLSSGTWSDTRTARVVQAIQAAVEALQG